MIRKTIASFLVLSMVLGLTACSGSHDQASGSGNEADSQETASGQESEGTEDEEEIPAEIPEEAKKDVISYLTDGAYTSGQVIGTVGETDITADEILYQAAYQYYQASYYYYQYGSEFDVNGTTEDGQVYSDLLLEYGKDSATANAMGRQKAREKGLELSEEDKESLASYYDNRVKAYGEHQWENALADGSIKEEDFNEEEKQAWITEQGTAAYDEDLLYLCNTRDGDAASYEKYLYTTMLESSLFDEGGEYALSDTQLSEKIQEYIKDKGVIWGRCILFPSQDSAAAEDDGTEEKDENAPSPEAQAAEVYDELSAVAGDALSQAFTEKQTEFDKSGYTAGEVQRYTSSDSLVDGYYSGLEKLSPGEVGITDETDYGWFVLLREEDDPESLKETVSSEYRRETFSGLFSDWMEEYEIDYSQLMPDLDAGAFYEKLIYLQKIIQAGKS